MAFFGLDGLKNPLARLPAGGGALPPSRAPAAFRPSGSRLASGLWTAPPPGCRLDRAAPHASCSLRLVGYASGWPPRASGAAPAERPCYAGSMLSA